MGLAIKIVLYAAFCCVIAVVFRARYDVGSPSRRLANQAALLGFAIGTLALIRNDGF